MVFSPQTGVLEHIEFLADQWVIFCTSLSNGVEHQKICNCLKDVLFFFCFFFLAHTLGYTSSKLDDINPSIKLWVLIYLISLGLIQSRYPKYYKFSRWWESPPITFSLQSYLCKPLHLLIVLSDRILKTCLLHFSYLFAWFGL